jgi:hypothetical protein
MSCSYTAELLCHVHIQQSYYVMFIYSRVIMSCSYTSTAELLCHLHIQQSYYVHIQQSYYAIFIWAELCSYTAELLGHVHIQQSYYVMFIYTGVIMSCSYTAELLCHVHIQQSYYVVFLYSRVINCFGGGEGMDCFEDLVKPTDPFLINMCLNFSLLLSYIYIYIYIYGAPSKTRNLTYIYGRYFYWGFCFLNRAFR